MKSFLFFLCLVLLTLSCNERNSKINNFTLSLELQEHELERKRLLIQEKFHFSDLYDFTEGLAVFKTDSTVGAIDTAGNVVFYIKGAISLSPFHFGYAVLTYQGELQTKAFINKTGKIIYVGTDHGLLHLDPFDNFGYSFVIDKNNRRGLIDTLFKTVIVPDFDDIFVIGKNRFHVINSFKSAIIDQTGKFLVDYKFSNIEYFTPDYKMIAKNNNQFGIYDSTGLLISLFDCNDLIYTGGLIAVKKSDKKGAPQWGYADTAGKIVIPYGKYNDCSSFSNGLAMVYNEQIDNTNPNYYSKQVGFIDITGKEKIPLEYEDGFSFREGVALVKKNRKWGYIDTSGKVVLDFIYDKADFFYKGFANVVQNGKSITIDQKGQPLF